MGESGRPQPLHRSYGGTLCFQGWRDCRFMKRRFRGEGSLGIATSRTNRSAPPALPLWPAKSPIKEFAAFRLDTLNQCLRRRGDGGREERILLTPKAFAVLEYLVERPG